MRSHRTVFAAAAAALLTLTPSCSTTAPQWGEFGADVIGCASPGISATIDAAADDLYARAAGAPGADWKSLGIGLAARYGVPMAICAVEAAFNRLGGAGHRALTPPYVDDAVRWLRANKRAWTQATPPEVLAPAAVPPAAPVPSVPATPAVPAPAAAPVSPAPPGVPVSPAPTAPAAVPASPTPTPTAPAPAPRGA